MIAVETAQLGERLEQALSARLPAAPQREALDRLADHAARLASPRKRGRPRDVYADAFCQVLDDRVLPSVQAATADAVVTLPRGVLTASEARQFEDRLVQTFAEFLASARKAARRWHYRHRRKVLGDLDRAMREAERRHRNNPDDAS
jgi:hypothetical protein